VTAPMSDHAVDVHQLCRTYPRRGAEPRVALDKADLTVVAGEVHGLLGPNGAGKTTLCKVLSTVLTPTSGRVRVAGFDVVREAAAVRRSVGVVFGGDRGLYTRLTARENLMYWSALYLQRRRDARTRIEGLLDRLGLTERADERVETYSRGMKQRLHLARGLVGDPRVLILDEPTTGMDPVAAMEFRRLIAELRVEGRTVLITTHDMAEAEAVCDRVTLVDGGHILGTENPRTIGGWLSAYERVTASGVSAEVADTVRAIPGVAAVEHDPQTGGLRVETASDGVANHVLRALVEAGVSEVATGRPSLSEVYLHLIGSRGLKV
jgi:ABC-2 type transport system ATP-binding protein